MATLHLQAVLGLSPLVAGACLLPLSLTAVLGSMVAGPMLRRWTMRRALAMGLAVIAVGNLVLVADQGQPTVLVAVATIGLGLGVASVAANSIGTDVLATLRATSARILNTAAQLGTAIGIALIILIATSSSYTTGWACAAATAAITAVVLASLGISRGQSPETGHGG